MSHTSPQLTLRNCDTFRVRYRASNHKINYVTQVQEIINFKGNLNCIIGSKVTVILLEGWILHVGGIALERVCFYNTDFKEYNIYIIFIVSL